MKILLVRLSVMVACLATSLAATNEGEFEQAFEMQTTLGQLCKISDFVGICSLDDVKTKIEAQTILVWKVDKNITGSSSVGSNFIVQTHMQPRYFPTKEERCLVFASQVYNPLTQGTNVNLNLFRWDFSRGIATAQTNEWHLVGEPRGIIILQPQSEKYLLASVTGYWNHLHGSSRSIENYYVFLRGQLNSSVKRIRSDASLDLRILMRFAEIDILRRIATDESLDEELRAHASKIMNWREANPL